jgi:ABC-type transporter Mla MlaB component
MASIEWTQANPSMYDPDVSPEEKWGVYSNHPTHHNLVGNLSTDIATSLSWETTATYIHQKQDLSLSKLHRVNTSALQRYLNSIPIINRVNTIKLIHGWLPTYALLCCQGRESSSLCPRCALRVETIDHIHQCTVEIAKKNAKD